MRRMSAMHGGNRLSNIAGDGSVEWFTIQERTFTRWINQRLSLGRKKPTRKHRHRRQPSQLQQARQVKEVKDLMTDLTSLHVVNLIEILSGRTIKRYNRRPRFDIHHLENLSIALQRCKEDGIKMVNISAEDVLGQNMRIILGLVWHLILHYDISGESSSSLDSVVEETPASSSSVASESKGGGTSDLLQWIQQQIPSRNITNFTTDWNDGKAICALCDALKPGVLPESKVMGCQPMVAADLGIKTAAKHLLVEALILPQEMIHPKLDRRAMATYLSQFRNYSKPKKQTQVRADNLQCTIDTSTLTDVVVKKPASFFIRVPFSVEASTDKLLARLDARIEGTGVKDPVVDIEVETAGSASSEHIFKCSFTADSVGAHFAIASLDDLALPNCPASFQVEGPRGRVEVFYTTTSFSRIVKANIDRLEQLLYIKKVHLRPDFVPWVAVDLMSPTDRDCIFERAGTKQLPIVFIDDEYVGGYDELAELNEIGELDKLLALHTVTLLTPEQHMARLLGEDTSSVDGPDGKRNTDYFCGVCGWTKLLVGKACPECGSDNPVPFTPEKLASRLRFIQQVEEEVKGLPKTKTSKWSLKRQTLGESVAPNADGEYSTGFRRNIDDHGEADDFKLEAYTATTMPSATDFIMAVYDGDRAKVQSMLESGFDPNVHDADGYSARDIAMKTGQGRMERLLIKFGAEFDNEDFFIAVSYGDLPLVRYMLEYGKADINMCDEDGMTPLMVAVSEQHGYMARFLRSKGAQTGGITYNEDLFIAVSDADIPATKAILEGEVSFLINAPDEDGNTAMCIAKEVGNQEIIDLLAKFGAVAI